MNKIVERLQNGIIKENPTFVLMLGMCPTLAVTTSAINGLGMGLSTALIHLLKDSMNLYLLKILVLLLVSAIQFVLNKLVTYNNKIIKGRD